MSWICLGLNWLDQNLHRWCKALGFCVFFFFFFLFKLSSSPLIIFCSVQFSPVTQCSTLCDPMDRSTPGLPVHCQLLESTQTHVHWVGDDIQTISSSVVPFSCLQSLPATGTFQMSQFFTSGGQSIVISASTSIFSMNIQDRFPLRWTGWISLLSKGLSRVFSNTTVQ